MNQRDAAIRSKHFFSACDGTTLIPETQVFNIQSPQDKVPHSKALQF